MNLEQLGITKEDIIDRVVTKIVENYEADCSHKDSIEYKVDKIINGKFGTLADEQIKIKISQIAEQALNHVYQPRNAWGDKEGEKTTLRDKMSELSINWLATKVNDRGEKSSRSSDITRAEWLVRGEIKRYYLDESTKLMRDQIESVKAEIHAQLKETIANVLAKHFRPAN